MKETEQSLFPYGKKVSIEMELYRVYVFSGGNEIRIENPKYLVVSNNGHRVCDGNNISHYVPYGWIHLYWECKDKEKFQFFFQRPESEKKQLLTEQGDPKDKEK